MGWISYEIPDLEVRGKFRLQNNLSDAFSALCDTLVEAITENTDENSDWESLTDVLKNDFEFIPEGMTAEDVKQAVCNKDSQYLNFHKLQTIRYDFWLIDEALDQMEKNLIFTQSDAESKFDDCSHVFGKIKGEYLLISEVDDACIGLQMTEEGIFLPELIEAYGPNYGSDYIPDAPDIFEAGDSPHRAFLDILEDDEQTEYMAYHFTIRQPEGDEDTREYAEYRDVFGPMRLEELKIKLSENTFISVTRNRWNGSNLKITLSRGLEKTDQTEFLDELATKHTKNLLNAKLIDWLNFFKSFHQELKLDLTEEELNYLEKLSA